MALWTPSDLAVQPRLYLYGPSAVFVSGALSAWTNAGSDGGAATIGGSPSVGTAINGLQTVRFDAAAKQVLHTLGVFAAGAISSFWFGKRLDATSVRGYFGRGWFGAGSVGAYLGSGIANFGSAHLANGNGALAPQIRTAADVVDAAAAHSVCSRLGAANSLYVDGVAQSFATNTQGATPGYASAAWVTGNTGSGGEHANSDFLVFMVFDYALSDADREKLEGWIFWATGLQAQLPVGHTYANAAPQTTPSNSLIVTEANDTLAANSTLGALPGAWAWDLPLSTLLASNYKVYAWWHIHRISEDNLPPASDFIHTRFNNPKDAVYGGFAGGYPTPSNGNGTKGYGAWIADRPVGRAPRPGNYALADCQTWTDLASAIGLNGFQHNITGIAGSGNGNYYADIGNNLEAARLTTLATGRRFEIMLMIDGAIFSSATNQQIIDVLTPFMSHANVSRHANGKLMLGSFAPEFLVTQGGQTAVQRWTSIKAAVGAFDGAGVFFVPSFLNSGLATDATWATIADGAGVWGGNVFSTQPGLATVGQQVKAQGRMWMPTIFPQDYRSKEHMVREAGGSALYRLAWDNAVANKDATKSYIASIACWNDYTENQMCPSEPGQGIQSSFYNLTAYYAYLYKMGAAPTIVRDQVFYWHRVEHTGGFGRPSGTGTLQPGAYIHDPSNAPADAFQDNFEIVAFVASAARIRITAGASSAFLDCASAGMYRTTLPWVTGVTPVFSIERPAGSTILSQPSAFTTRSTSEFQSLDYKGGNSPAVVPFTAGGTGDLQITEGDDSAASGGVLAVSGTLAATEAVDTLLAQGVIAVVATLSATEADDILTGLMLQDLGGAVNATEADDQSSATGVIVLNGALAVDEADDTLTGAAILAIQGQAAPTEDGDTLASDGAVAISGSANIVEVDDDLLSGSGSVGVGAVFLGAEDDDALTADGSLPLNGDLSAANDDDILSADAFLEIQAAFAAIEDDDTVSADGAIALSGSVDVVEDDDALDSASVIPLFGSADGVENDDLLSSDSSFVQFNTTADLNAAEDDDVLSAIGFTHHYVTVVVGEGRAVGVRPEVRSVNAVERRAA